MEIICASLFFHLQIKRIPQILSRRSSAAYRSAGRSQSQVPTLRRRTAVRGANPTNTHLATALRHHRRRSAHRVRQRVGVYVPAKLLGYSRQNALRARDRAERELNMRFCAMTEMNTYLDFIYFSSQTIFKCIFYSIR